MDFHELIIRHALRYNYIKVIRLLLSSSFTTEMHLEFAFFIMKHIISHRKYINYSIVRELAKQLTTYKLPSTSQECIVHRIERAVAYIVGELFKFSCFIFLFKCKYLRLFQNINEMYG